MRSASDKQHPTESEPSQADVSVPDQVARRHSSEHARLHATFADNRRFLDELSQHERRSRERRIDAVLSLKKNLDETCLKFQESALRRKKKTKRLEDQQANESQELLNQGKNPHEVFRQRQVEQDAESQRRQLESAIANKQLDILKRLEVEKSHQRRQDQAHTKERAFEIEYQKEMGRTAEDRRVHDFMLSRTGKELVDPTSKQFRLFPSQETTIPDRSFGLGKNLVHSADQRATIVEQIHAKFHYKTKTRPLLLPRVDGARFGDDESTRDSTSLDATTDGAAVSSGAVKASLVPGSNLKALNQTNATASILPPISANGHETASKLIATPPAHRKKGFGIPRRSVLEMKMMVEALERQKEQVFEPQVVWGKEFLGQAFLCDPPVLWFKDFDVGVKTTIIFQLTNVSNTFNQFKILDLPEKYCDVFELHYEKPGRMSAGTNCKLHLSFCAIQNTDIDMEIPAIAKTGPFGIKVKCTSKKAVPVLKAERLEFADIVIGETKAQTLILENQGALELPYHISLRPILHSDSSFDSKGGEKDADGDGGFSPRATQSGLDMQIHTEAERREASNTSVDQPSESEDPGASTVKDPVKSLDRMARTQRDEQAFLDYAKSFETRVNQRSSVYEWLRFPKEGSVNPYSSKNITFTFAPMVPVPHEGILTVEFPHPASTTKKLLVPIRASTLQLPIYLENQVLDFECCCYEKLYRHKLVVRNRGKVSLRIEIRLPHALESVFEFLPSMGYVQGASSVDTDMLSGQFEVLVKFRPTEFMWKFLEKKKFGSKQLLMFALPVQIIVPDQVIPVYTVLTARITPVDLTLDPSTLVFGECIVGQSLSRQVLIHNTSRLPQRFGFIKLPREVAVNPNDGFGTLLPDETRPLSVVYSPLAATDLKCNLICQGSSSQQYELPCIGVGVVAPLSFSHNVIQLASVAVGQSSVCSITCENTTDDNAMFEIVQPKGSEEFLRISPKVGSLSGRKKVRIEIAFAATDALFELKSTVFDGSDVLSTEACVSNPGSDAKQDPNEPKSCHHCFHVLCYVNAGKKKWPLMVLDINTSVILPRVAAQPCHLDFGQVAIGQVLQKEFELMNCTSQHTIQLAMQPLHAFGAFRLVNCLRRLSPSGVKRHRIEFRPTAQKSYEEELIVMFSSAGLKSAHENVVISLRGEGINPQLEILPSNGLLDFRDVLAKNRMTMDIVLRNLSMFPLPFHLKSLDQSEMTLGNLPVFTCVPSEAVIQPNSAITVRTTFSPERERPSHYQHRWKIEVPNENEEHILTAIGRCWDNQLYLFADPGSTTCHVEAPAVEDIFDGFGSTLALSPLPQLASMCEFMARKPTRVVTLVFAENEISKQLFVGSTLAPLPEGAQAAVPMPGTSASAPSGVPPSNHGTVGNAARPAGGAPSAIAPPVVAGSFEFTMDPEDEKFHEYFSIDLAKGSINVGQQQTIHIEFQPRKKAVESPEALAFHQAHHDLLVPQRIQLRVQCTLRGGALWKSSVFGVKKPGDATDAQQPAVQCIRLVLQAQIHTTL